MAERYEVPERVPGGAVAPDRFMTAEQVADRWQVHASSVYRAARRPGGLPSLMIGGARRFRVADVLAFEQRCRVQPGTGSRAGRLLDGG